MKVALCFLISGDHILNKEQLWIDWINHNKDLFNIYFHYKDLTKITSPWIKKYAIPHIVETSYFHVTNAYITLLNHAQKHDEQNQWFIFLTESCIPIISPKKFLNLFLSSFDYSIFNWRKPWWNINYCKRANLNKLQPILQLGHDPYFILKREDAIALIKVILLNKEAHKLYNFVCQGGLANESVFAIMFQIMWRLNTACMMQYSTHLTDWTRMTSPTSPHVFTADSDIEVDSKFICEGLKTNKFAMFLRKVGPSFPDEVLNRIIYKPEGEKDGEKDGEGEGEGEEEEKEDKDANRLKINNKIIVVGLIGLFFGFIYFYSFSTNLKLYYYNN